MTCAALNRVARRELGRTLTAEIIRQRLAHARILLAETNLTLKAIAAETGFCHAAHLANAFRKAYALSPGRFRAANGTAHGGGPPAEGRRRRTENGRAAS